ncbi:MAG: hypothetical protein M1819_006273 [Sarea resinae]|nr:MAG: hypothetical protein M1819_006273 [Sarea resinae]
MAVRKILHSDDNPHSPGPSLVQHPPSMSEDPEAPLQPPLLLPLPQPLYPQAYVSARYTINGFSPPTYVSTHYFVDDRFLTTASSVPPSSPSDLLLFNGTYWVIDRAIDANDVRGVGSSGPDSDRLSFWTAAIEPNSRLSKEWRRGRLQEVVARFLDPTRADWLTVDFVRSGFESDPERLPPTVLVTVPDGAESRVWLERAKRLHRECVDLGYPDVCVRIRDAGPLTRPTAPVPNTPRA